jgi:FixJ family two-component response regulator
MSEANSIVYIVDDDRDVRSSLSFILGTLGTRSRPFAGGRDFVDSLDHLEPGSVLLDIRMPGMDGVEVLEELAKRSIAWPVIVMTGHGEISLAVQTMRMGAMDFLEKPFDEELLQSCLARADKFLEQETHASSRRREATRRLDALTDREREVLEALMDGLSNRQIAERLDISLRTAEMHRGNMMHRLGVKGLAEALHIVTDAGMERQSRISVTPLNLV